MPPSPSRSVTRSSARTFRARPPTAPSSPACSFWAAAASRSPPTARRCGEYLRRYAPIRSQAYFVLRVTECLTLVAVGMYFLTRHAQWNAYVLAVYAVSGAAGLVLSSALLTSRIVPKNLSILGLVGYPVFLVGSILAMFHLIDVTHGDRDAGAGPRRPLRADPADLALHQGIHFPPDRGLIELPQPWRDAFSGRNLCSSRPQPKLHFT